MRYAFAAEYEFYFIRFALPRIVEIGTRKQRLALIQYGLQESETRVAVKLCRITRRTNTFAQARTQSLNTRHCILQGPEMPPFAGNAEMPVRNACSI